jgi:hypothetical protein
MGQRRILQMAPFFWPYFCLSYDIRHVSMHKHKHLSRLMLENEKAWNCFERDQTDARLAENMLISSTLLKSKSKWGDSSREPFSLAELTEPHFSYSSWSVDWIPCSKVGLRRVQLQMRQTRDTCFWSSRSLWAFLQLIVNPGRRMVVAGKGTSNWARKGVTMNFYQWSAQRGNVGIHKWNMFNVGWHSLIIDEVFCCADSIRGPTDGDCSVGLITWAADSDLGLWQISNLANLDTILSNDTSNELRSGCKVQYLIILYLEWQSQ